MVLMQMCLSDPNYLQNHLMFSTRGICCSRRVSVSLSVTSREFYQDS